MTLIAIGVSLKPRPAPIATVSSDIDLVVDGHTISPKVSNTTTTELSESQVLPIQELPPDLKRKASAIIKAFIYDDELKKIETLSAQLPESKSELVKIITTPNPFDKAKIPLKLHSTEQVTHRQIESVKILALKALLQHEKSKANVIGDLNHIIKSTEDTPIKKLAHAVRESAQNGKSYFKDAPLPKR